MDQLRIYYIGKFQLDFATERYVQWALENRHGCNVMRYKGQSVEDVKTILKEYRPHVVLFSKVEPKYTARLLEWCREKRILTVAWIWDLYWGCRSERPKQFRADMLFTTDAGHQKEFNAYRTNHKVLRQGIHEPHHRMYLPPQYKNSGGQITSEYLHDVAFVGGATGHPSRTKLVRWLKRTYGPRMIHHTNVRGLDLNRALARAKVVVGDTWPSRHYWSNRIYEILGRGGFLLHPRTEGLSREFTDRVHYVAYERDDFPRLRRTIDHWLSNEAEREAIRNRGFQLVGRHYTYTVRTATLLDCIRTRLGKT